MNIRYPNYEECITNIPCSVLKYFGLDAKHNTIKEIDEELKSNPKNVVVMLFDGMGYNLINRILDENTFLRKNMIKDISSVCPSTTTASTTSMMSGLNPCEHGWCGWDNYIPTIGKIVSMFPNKYKDTDILVSDKNISKDVFPYKSVTDRINEETEYYSKILFPFGTDPYKDLNDMGKRINSLCKKDGKKFIYAYSEEPDTTMHLTGTDSKETKEMFEKINDFCENLCGKLDDTLIVITADHGHINFKNILLKEDYPDFFDTLDGNTWLEGRFCCFKVKNEKEFLKLFKKYFINDFILKSKKELLDENILGVGEYAKNFEASLGDYYALAIGNKGFKYDVIRHEFQSTHAGLTEDEMRIPLILKRK